MSKAIKIWLIVAAALILIGSMIFVGVMSLMEWNFMNLSTDKVVENEHEISADLKNIIINSTTSDIKILPSNDEKIRIKCRETKKLEHEVYAINDTLEIVLNDERKWYEHIQIGINLSIPTVTVYLPQKEYDSLTVKSSASKVEVEKALCFGNINIEVSTGDVDCDASVKESLKIKASTGDIDVENASVGSLELSASTGKITASKIDCEGDVNVSVSTGKVTLSDIRCNNLISTGDTGDITLLNVVAAEKFDINRSTGDVRLEGCDASEIFIVTDTGRVSGSLLSSKIFVTKTDTGDIDVPYSDGDGRCEIRTDTGDVIITVKG